MRYEDYIKTDDSTAEDEKKILMDSIREHKPMVIVETGTHHGLTACYLAEVAKEYGGHVHTYDPYNHNADENIAQFPELPITVYRERGDSCSLPVIDWAFIDGYHEKEEVLSEIDAIFPRLSDGAVVFFHDTNGRNPFCDVPSAIEARDLSVEYTRTTNGIAKYIHKKKENA